MSRKFKAVLLLSICILAVVYFFQETNDLKVMYLDQHGDENDVKAGVPIKSNAVSPSPEIQKQKLVVIFTNKRSGSSLLGEFFNQNDETFYLFEPLFPFTRTCEVLVRERVSALKELLLCNFTNIRSIYANAFQVTQHTDQYAKCNLHNICFMNRHGPLLQKYDAHCKELNLKCGFPMNTSVLSELCFKSPIVVLKILRVCDMSTMEDMLEEFSRKLDVDLKIIHLLRDPRAILSSRLQLDIDETKPTNLKEAAQSLCERLYTNIKFADKYWRANETRGTSYLRIRHEYITMHPLDAARVIYDFVEEPMSDKMKSWIQSRFVSEDANFNAAGSPFSTKRRASDVINKWRRKLTLDQVLMIQEQCSSSMSMLSYMKADNQKHLNEEGKFVLY